MTTYPKLDSAGLRGAREEGLRQLRGEAPADQPEAIVFWYRNYQGDEGYRRVKPISIRYGTSEWHKEPQWLMLADDTVNNKRREFAMKDMSSVIGSPVLAFQQKAGDSNG